MRVLGISSTSPQQLKALRLGCSWDRGAPSKPRAPTPPGAGPSSSTAGLRAAPLKRVQPTPRTTPNEAGQRQCPPHSPHSSPSVKTHPVAEVCASRQDRGHAHVDQEGLPVSRTVRLLLLRGGQLFLGGNRCLGTLKTSTHLPFSNFSVLTRAAGRGREVILL